MDSLLGARGGGNEGEVRVCQTYLQRLWIRIGLGRRLLPTRWRVPRRRLNKAANQHRTLDDGELVSVVVAAGDRVGDCALAPSREEDGMSSAAVDATQQRLELGRARMLELAHVTGVAPRALVDQHLGRIATAAPVAVGAHLVGKLHAVDHDANVPLRKRVGRVGLPKHTDRVE